MPLGLFRLRNVAVANVVGVLWAAAMFAWFFLSALYLQLVLGYSPLQVGLAFLPANLIMGAFSLGLSAKLVMRFGIARRSRAGCAGRRRARAFARAPVDGNFVVDVLPSMILLGFGAGMAFNPVLLAAMSDVEPSESGLASGVVNTSFMMGGALGLAVLASLAASRTDSLLASGDSALAALNGGYHARLPRRRDLRRRRGGGFRRRHCCASRHRKRTESEARRARDQPTDTGALRAGRERAPGRPLRLRCLVAEDEAVVVDPCISADEVKRIADSTRLGASVTCPRDARGLGSRLWHRGVSRRHCDDG